MTMTIAAAANRRLRISCAASSRDGCTGVVEMRLSQPNSRSFASELGREMRREGTAIMLDRLPGYLNSGGPARTSADDGLGYELRRRPARLNSGAVATSPRAVNTFRQALEVLRWAR
jgi:hypothetical protein